MLLFNYSIDYFYFFSINLLDLFTKIKNKKLYMSISNNINIIYTTVLFYSIYFYLLLVKIHKYYILNTLVFSFLIVYKFYFMNFIHQYINFFYIKFSFYLFQSIIQILTSDQDILVLDFREKILITQSGQETSWESVGFERNETLLDAPR